MKGPYKLLKLKKLNQYLLISNKATIQIMPNSLVRNECWSLNLSLSLKFEENVIQTDTFPNNP